MFENFSERGRHTIVSTQAEARGLQHHYIGTEHLLIAIMAEGHGIAAAALAASGVTAEQVRHEVSEVVGSGPDPVAGQMPFNPRMRSLFLRANRIRLSLGAVAVEPEHLLLAMVRDDGGVAIQLLSHFGIDPETIRAQVVRAVSNPAHGS